MQCPRCTAELQNRVEAGITVEDCPSCTGMWFDGDELTEYLGQHLPQLEHVDPKLRQKALMKENVSAIACPRCSSVLDRIHYAYASPIELDECGGCGGVWIDAGELNAIYAYRLAQKSAGSDPAIRAAEATAAMEGQTLNVIQNAKRLKAAAAVLKMRHGLIGGFTYDPDDVLDD